MSIRTTFASLLVLSFCLHGLAIAEPKEPQRTGRIEFQPAANEDQLPELFRLNPHEFDFRQAPLETVSTSMAIYEVTFPSPVETPHANNNTVHAEYYRPLTDGKHPAVVVLHILGGDFNLSRLFARQLAGNGVAALFIKLPYYGPRRQPGVDARMVSTDPRQTVQGMRQAVLDIRRGAAWLAAQSEVDAQQLGVFGISLGGITGALAATAEPRFANICLMLAGGDVAQVSWSSSKLARLREQWLGQGGTREEFFELLKPIDPVTYGENVRGRRILMLNASHDEIIPRACTESLWRAFGQPEIVWMDAGHYSAMRFIFDGLSRVTKFFNGSAELKASPAAPEKPSQLQPVQEQPPVE
ncbi:MAG: alpha/beta hydrolase family protein [Pirellulales bacterium]